MCCGTHISIQIVFLSPWGCMERLPWPSDCARSAPRIFEERREHVNFELSAPLRGSPIETTEWPIKDPARAFWSNQSVPTPHRKRGWLARRDPVQVVVSRSPRHLIAPARSGADEVDLYRVGLPYFLFTLFPSGLTLTIDTRPRTFSGTIL